MSEVLERATTFADLVEIPPQNALAVFTSATAIDPILARVKREIDAFVPDVSTASGRRAIASIAHKVAQSKTALEAVGKRLADEQKEVPKKIDATRRKIRDTLDAWKDEVRQPLTDWETIEDARTNAHVNKIAEIGDLAASARLPNVSANDLRKMLATVAAVVIGPACEEFEAEYAIAKETAVTALQPAIVAREQYEAEQAELVRLRKEAAARAEADRIEKIKKEAADAARLEAENDARVERERVANAAKLAAAEAARKDAEHKAAIAAAEQRAVDMAAKIKAEHEAAAAAERAAQAKREADTKHKAAINRAALAVLVEHGIGEESAKLVIKLIAGKKVPAISIQY